MNKELFEAYQKGYRNGNTGHMNQNPYPRYYYDHQLYAEGFFKGCEEREARIRRFVGEQNLDPFEEARMYIRLLFSRGR